MRKNLFPISLLAVLLSLFVACASDQAPKPDKEAIQGIWHVVHYQIGGHDQGDGLCWFEFKAGGKMATRAAADEYETGTWELDDKTKVIKMRDDDPTQHHILTELHYKLNGDSLQLFETESPVPYLMSLSLLRTDKHPITQAQEQGGGQ